MKRVGSCLLMLLLGLAAGRLLPEGRSNPSKLMMMTTRESRPSIEAVQALASLVTTTVSVSDVQMTELRGYTGSTKAALLVRGDFQLGTDLSQAKFTEISSDRKRAVIVLAKPVAAHPRVDLERSRLVSVTSDGLWEVIPGCSSTSAVTDSAYREAQAMVERVSLQPEWIAGSERQAVEVIQTFFRSISWTIEIRWAPSP